MLPIKFKSIESIYKSEEKPKPTDNLRLHAIRYNDVEFTNDFGSIKKDEKMKWLLFYPDTFEIKTSNRRDIIQCMSVFPTGMGKKVATLPSEINDLLNIDAPDRKPFEYKRVLICVDGPDEIGKSTLLSQTDRAIHHHTRYHSKLGKLAGDYAFGKYDGGVKKHLPCLPIFAEEALFLSSEKMCVEIHSQLDFLELLNSDTFLVMDRSLITTLRYFSPKNLDKVASYQYANHILTNWLYYLTSLNIHIVFVTIGDEYVDELPNKEAGFEMDNISFYSSRVPCSSPIEVLRGETITQYDLALLEASEILGRDCSRKVK